MIKYQVTDDVLRIINIELDADTGNSFASIEITGDADLKAIVEDILATSYGAFGHSIGSNATSPIDLDAALKSPNFDTFAVELIEGFELVSSYDPGIPEGAVT